MNQSTRPIVLIVDPDPLTLTGLSATLHHEKLEVHGARTRTAALRAAQDLPLDLMVLDCWIEPDLGQNLIRSVRMLPHLVDMPVVLITDPGNDVTIPMPTAAFEVQKPLDLEAFIAVVKRAVWMPHMVHSPSQPKPHTFSGGTHAPSVAAEHAIADTPFLPF